MPKTKKKSSSDDRTNDRPDRKVERITFHIFGEDFTRICRDLMWEGNWVKALNLIMEGLPGVSWELAIDVLECRKRFEGDNQFTVADEDPEDPDIKERLRNYSYTYGPTLEYRQHYFVPYARVTSWAYQDFSGPRYNRFITKESKTARIGGCPVSTTFRSLYYANDPHNDVCFGVTKTEKDDGGDGVIVLFREVVMPPPWRKPHTDPSEAYAEYVEKFGLPPKRGAHENFLGAPWDLADDEKPDEEDIPGSFLSNRRVTRDAADDDGEEEDLPGGSGLMGELAKQTAAMSGLPLDVVMGTVDAVTGKQDTESEPQALKDTGPNGYVLRNGKFYACNYHAHAALARRLLKWELVSGDPDIDDPEKHIEQNCGVARLSTGPVGGPRYQYMKKPTRAQEKVVVDWCLKYNVPYAGHNY